MDALLGDSKLTGIRILRGAEKTPEVLSVTGMFVAIGQQPENEAFAALSKLDQTGYIISDENCSTDTEGIFVAGDCRTKAIRQVVTATADGASAALAACRYLDRL